MAKKRGGGSKFEGGNWLDTYADMVTLLLCFFVLLYSASTVDETKWQYIYQSFTSSGTYVNPFVMDEAPKNNATESNGNADAPPHENSGTTDEEIEGLPENFNQLYSYISTQIENNDMSNYVSIKKSDTRIFISLDNRIAFDGNSAVLKEEAKRVLQSIIPGIRALNSVIKYCTVSGHTAKALSDVNDWDLSAARASSVVKYMDYNRAIDSEKFTVQGKACYSPVADNSTAEGRAKNRRVEIMIVEDQLDTTAQNVIDDIMKYDYRLVGVPSDPWTRPSDSSNDSQDTDYANSIIDALESKYETNENDGEETNIGYGPVYVPPYSGIPTDILLDPPEDESAEAQ